MARRIGMFGMSVLAGALVCAVPALALEQPSPPAQAGETTPAPPRAPSPPEGAATAPASPGPSSGAGLPDTARKAGRPAPRVSAGATAGIEALLSQGSQAVNRGALTEAIARLEAALDLARELAPLEARRFLLVQEEPPGFGQYLPRRSNLFSPGEEMLFYLEPVNYNFRRKGELFEAWLKVDVNLLLPDGTIIYGKRNFFEQVFSARSRIHDLFLNLSLEVSGLDEGEYRVEYVVKDGFSGKACTVQQEVVIREPEPVLNP